MRGSVVVGVVPTHMHASHWCCAGCGVHESIIYV